MTEPVETPSVAEAAELIARGELSSTSLVRHCLDRIEETDGELNAFVHVDGSGALARAREIDRRIARGTIDGMGPLAGIPFAVKDLEDCAGMPTTKGSRWFAGQPARTSDSIHVGRLRTAGAIPIGKTTTPEFGAWAYTASPLLGVTRNPWDPSRTPGGSSGGSAAAVSAGLVPFATASDGGGSIRTPAAFCGLVGLRAGYGRIPTLGDTHLAQNAVVGALTTTVVDTALLLDVMAGPDPRDRTALGPPGMSYLERITGLDLSGVRIAFSANLGFAVVDPAVATVARAAAEDLARACGIDLIDSTVHLDDPTRVYIQIEGVDKFVGVDPELWRTRLDELDPLSAPGWTFLSTRTLPEQAAVEAARREIVHATASIFEGIDLLLTPATGMEAFAAEGPMPTEIAGQAVHPGMSVALSFVASVVNLPAISVPAGFGPSGLPVGLQIIGPRHREDIVLAAAARLEAARPWPRLCERL